MDITLFVHPKVLGGTFDVRVSQESSATTWLLFDSDIMFNVGSTENVRRIAQAMLRQVEQIEGRSAKTA